MRMKEKWTWIDYDMEGPPPIDFDDWTIEAYGRESEINELVERMKYFSERGARQLLRLIAWWGSGKSTFLYNVCYRINDRLFFADEIEKPEEESYRHVLALYLKGPVKRREFLEYTLENGLPIPWKSDLSRDDAAKKRRELWYECVRKLAFILLRKAISEIVNKRLEGEAISGSAFLKELFENLLNFRNLKTNDFIKKIDELYVKDTRVFDELGELLRYYIRMLMHPIEERVGRAKVVRQEDFEIEFPRLLYPCASSSFLTSYRKLFGSPDTNLRRFTAFEKILKNTSTFAFVVMDEVEDWSKITRDKIDFDLHDIAADAESPISMVLIFRTEALKGVRSAPSLERYMTIVDRFTDISLKELGQKEVEELTAGVLSTARKGKMNIFPCTEDFIVELAARSKRLNVFNIRQYIRTLISILERSLNWPREDVRLTRELLDLSEAKEIIAGIAREEEQRSKIFKPPEVEE